MKYDFTDIEKKWQKRWDEEKTFAARLDKSKKKYYALVEFPYPSGQGLHIGHPRPYTAMDIVARKRRMQGYSVLFPSDGMLSDFPPKITPSRITYIPRL